MVARSPGEGGEYWATLCLGRSGQILPRALRPGLCLPGSQSARAGLPGGMGRYSWAVGTLPSAALMWRPRGRRHPHTLEKVVLGVHVRVVGDDVEGGPASHHLEHQDAQSPPVHAEPWGCRACHTGWWPRAPSQDKPVSGLLQPIWSRRKVARGHLHF